MKKLSVMVIGFFFASGSAFAQMAVLDAANAQLNTSKYLLAIDEFYQSYDILMNSYTQIQNQIESMKQAVEQAKGINWDDMGLNGGFDIRDDIKAVNRRVNDNMNRLNKISEVLNNPCIQVGSQSMSLHELCSVHGVEKMFETTYNEGMGKMWDTMKLGLTREEEEAIWRKYGISGKNLKKIIATKKACSAPLEKVMGLVSNELAQMLMNEEDYEDAMTLEAIQHCVDSNGNRTAGSYAEEQNFWARKGVKSVEEMIALERAIMDYQLKQQIATDAELEAKKQEMLQNQTAVEWEASQKMWAFRQSKLRERAHKNKTLKADYDRRTKELEERK